MENDQRGWGSRLSSLLRQGAREILTTVLPALLLALLVNMFVGEAVAIEDGPSMQPNLYRGDRMLTEKISYQLHPPRRGDVVIVD
ncbi:MAG: S26 family signal peptidase, partial [Anaerolineae bacterium]